MFISRNKTTYNDKEGEKSHYLCQYETTMLIMSYGTFVLESHASSCHNAETTLIT